MHINANFDSPTLDLHWILYPQHAKLDGHLLCTEFYHSIIVYYSSIQLVL